MAVWVAGPHCYGDSNDGDKDDDKDDMDDDSNGGDRDGDNTHSYARDNWHVGAEAAADAVVARLDVVVVGDGEVPVQMQLYPTIIPGISL